MSFRKKGLDCKARARLPEYSRLTEIEQLLMKSEAISD